MLVDVGSTEQEIAARENRVRNANTCEGEKSHREEHKRGKIRRPQMPPSSLVWSVYAVHLTFIVHHH